jgi:hypothetical protein
MTIVVKEGIESGQRKRTTEGQAEKKTSPFFEKRGTSDERSWSLRQRKRRKRKRKKKRW